MVTLSTKSRCQNLRTNGVTEVYQWWELRLPVNLLWHLESRKHGSLAWIFWSRSVHPLVLTSGTELEGTKIIPIQPWTRDLPRNALAKGKINHQFGRKSGNWLPLAEVTWMPCMSLLGGIQVPFRTLNLAAATWQQHQIYIQSRDSCQIRGDEGCNFLFK